MKSFCSRHLLQLWAISLGLISASLGGGMLLAGYRLHHGVLVLILGVVAIGAERESIKVTPSTEVSVASLLSVFAAVVLGPLAGAVVAALGLLADLPRRDTAQPILRWSIWTARRFIAAGVAGLAAAAILHNHSTDFFVLFGAAAAAFAADTLIELAIDPIAPLIRGSATYPQLLKSVAPALLASVPLHTPVVAVLAYAYTRLSPWSVILFAIPAFAAQRLLLLYRQQRETAEALTDLNERLARANLSFATALVATLDARDRYTAGHSAAVAIYARDIAKRMGLTESEQELAHVCGLVHDVGKIGLPAGLLEKPGALSLDERRQMEKHSEIGERILRNVDDYARIAEIVRHHHERVDGNGYPDRLTGEAIPIVARIISVADAYNAMTSDRPYRDAMPSRVARLRLAQAVETQFDTSVVASFEAILAGASEGYRVGTDAEFVMQHVAVSAAAEVTELLVPSHLDEDLRIAAASAVLAV